MQTTMNTFAKKYAQSVAWSTIEAIIFQTALLAHQALLFKTISPSLYGFTGTLFGLIYFGVKLFDLGLSRGLMTFYQDFSLNKNSCLQFFKYQIIPNLIFCCITFVGLWTVHLFFRGGNYIQLPIDSFLLALACGLALTETIKSVLKRLLQLSYNFRNVALFEIGFIASYQMAVWSYYFYTASLNAHVIIGFCFFMSLIEIGGLLFLTGRWYSSLPTAEQTLPSISAPIASVFKGRLLVYGHSISKQFFSGNIIIPLSAYSFGFESAALLKLASYMTHSITAIIEKIIDPSSSALFAQTKNESLEDKQNFFLLVSTASCHILLCTLIFIVINCTKLFTYSPTTVAIAPYVVLYFLIHYFENFFITIEKFYIAHDRSEFLIIGTVLNGILALSLFTYCLSPLLALMLLLVSRITAFIILVFYLSSLWNIRPRIHITPHYIVGSLFISVIFFMIF